MKLILIDKQDLATLARKEILQDQFHFNIDYVSSYEDFAAWYAKGKYHIVMLDFSLEAGAKALEMIDSVDPKQRVIIISDSEKYSEPNGCAYCVEHYNRRRLKEPVSVFEVANLIRDFDYTACAYYHE